MRVFLTGGTGLIGSHLAAQLMGEGAGVVALRRSTSDVAFLAGLGVELVEGDVTDDVAGLAASMRGCSHLVHGAALVYSGGGWEEIRRVNVEGTERTFRAAAMAGIGAGVHISSVAVYGTVDDKPAETEPLTLPLPDGDFYARSKREAEEVARTVASETGLRLTTVRPSAVYGERDRLMAPTIADILRLPLVPLFGPGDNTLPVVYAGNVAEGIRLALEGDFGGDTFDLGLDHPLTQRDLFRLLAEGIGTRIRHLRLPAALVSGVAGTLSRLGVRTPGAKHLPLERVARLALGENPYPSTRAREVLGWRPSDRHEEALPRTGRWLRNRM